MSKTFTQEQVDKLAEKEVAKAQKAVLAATKAETKRVLGIIKEEVTAAKEIESKEVKEAVTMSLKELAASIKEAT
jgi:hypothetical protein